MRNQRRAVLAIGPLPPPMNGMTVMTVRALEALQVQALNVQHLDTSDHRHVANVERLDLTNIYLALKHGLQAAVAMAVHRPSIVYLPIAQGTLGFLRDAQFFLSARLFGARTLVHFHGGEFSSFYRESGPIVRWLIRWCMRTCAGAIVLGRTAADDLAKVLTLPFIAILPNGTAGISDVARFEHRAGAVRILYLSNLMERKGYRDMVRAAEIVIAARQNVIFILAGAETAHSSTAPVREMVSRALATGRLRVSGEVTGLRKTELFRTADIFVFPPIRPEGHPIVVLEAMSAGLPVIATDIGGMRETVQAGISGILVRPEAPDELAEAILTLVDSAELRRSMGAAGARRFERDFSSLSYARRLGSTVSAALERVYKQQGVA
jgi:glycosyltransferase involved in cell wall biosynthesis